MNIVLQKNEGLTDFVYVSVRPVSFSLIFKQEA